MAVTLTESAAPAMVRAFDNGHYRKDTPSKEYEGSLENLPYPERFDLPSAIEAMYTDGYAIIPGALSAQAVAELRHKMDTSGEPDEKYDHTKIGWCFNKQLTVEYHKDPHFLRYIDLPGVADIARGVMGKNCRVKSGSLWITGPGRKMPIHADSIPVAMPEEILADPRVRIPIVNCVVQFYLSDQVQEIGPTILIPGSHRAGRAPNNETEWNGKRPKAAMVKSGDAVFFRFDCWHGAYANSSKDLRRYIMQLEYCHHTLALSYPPMAYAHYYDPEVLKQATNRQRELLGGSPVVESKKY